MCKYGAAAALLVGDALGSDLQTKRRRGAIAIRGTLPKKFFLIYSFKWSNIERNVKVTDILT